MEVQKIAESLIVNGKEVRPAQFGYAETINRRVDVKTVDGQIERLTAELAKWQSIKNSIVLKKDDIIETKIVS